MISMVLEMKWWMDIDGRDVSNDGNDEDDEYDRNLDGDKSLLSEDSSNFF